MTEPTEPAPRHVQLHPLHLRDEGREWVVGRIDTGRFVALPPIGVRVIELLRENSVAEATTIIGREQGEPVDVASFVGSLRRLGFIAVVDGRHLDDVRPVRSTLAWIKPAHVRWTLHRAVPIIVGVVVLAALISYLFHRRETIDASDLLWNEHGSLVVGSIAALMWASVFLHELAHLTTARAAGAPGRMSLGTRLQFLTAQTDVSGIWSARRSTRVTVYLSGMVVNLFLAAVGVLLASYLPYAAGRTFGAILCIQQLLLVSSEFKFFMRTDMYFLAQDLTGCRNLYRDATAYISHLTRRALGRGGETDPTQALPARERRFVRMYAAFFLPGTVVTLGFFVIVSVPLTIGLIFGAIHHLVEHSSVWSVLDAAVVLGLAVLGQILWSRAWWRRYGERVRKMTRQARARLQTKNPPADGNTAMGSDASPKVAADAAGRSTRSERQT